MVRTFGFLLGGHWCWLFGVFGDDDGWMELVEAGKVGELEVEMGWR